MPPSKDREDIDEEFPLGDGTADTADTAATVYCPYCNEPVEISLDAGSGGTQEYVEDCEVCCQPWTVSVRYGVDGSANVTVTPLEGQ
jgi:hypothetical protein